MIILWKSIIVCDVPKSENESEDKKEDDNPQISELKI